MVYKSANFCIQNEFTGEESTAVMKAVSSGNTAAVKYFVTNGAKLDIKVLFSTLISLTKQ